MMSFISIEFWLFFSCIFILYYIFPKKYRYIILAVMSYVFYVLCDLRYTVLLLMITVITYTGAFLLQTRYKKFAVVMLSGTILTVLVIFKFNGFFSSNIEYILSKLGIEMTESRFTILVPIGISFYSLQTLGYLFDVYKGKTSIEKNFFKYSLFASFFLTILSGPIERTGNLLRQIQIGTEFSYEKAKKGLLLIAYGFLQKIMIADRIATLVNNAFSNYEGQTGAALVVALGLYGIQIYADFAGYSNIAVGAANLLGFDLIQNFRQPYFAQNIKEFWKRWHISLSSWLRDYVYIPLGGSRCSKIRLYNNIAITFFLSAIWHGAGWKYIIWGALHGIYQIVGNATQGYRAKLKEMLPINVNCFSYRLLQRIFTFGMVNFAWLFFGASSMSNAVNILKCIIFNFEIGNMLGGKSYLLGMPEIRFVILIAEIIIILLVDILHERGISIVEWFNGQNIIFRWLAYMFGAMFLLTGIIYNYGLETSGFIYTRF